MSANPRVKEGISERANNLDNPHNPDIAPWYRQFWWWFIVSLPAAAVVASLGTVAIAVIKQDSLVADNYYQQGLAINKLFAEEENARSLAVEVDIVIDHLVGELTVELRGNFQSWPSTLTMAWQHPIKQQRDISLTLLQVADNRYLGQLPQALSGRWYLQLSGDQPMAWLVKKQLTVQANSNLEVELESFSLVANSDE